MNNFYEKQLKMKYVPPMNKIGPIDGRKYTLTHSNDAEEFHVSVSKKYDVDMIDETRRDELLAKWHTKNGEYQLHCKMHISGGEFDRKFAKARYLKFKKEAENTLTAIAYGEQELFFHFPWLLDTPIYIQFESVFPEYNQVVYYGTPRQYLSAATNQHKSRVKTQA